MNQTDKQREHAEKRISNVRKNGRQVIDTETGEVSVATRIDIDAEPREVIVINKKRGAMDSRFVMVTIAAADTIQDLRYKKQWRSSHDIVWTEIQRVVGMKGYFKLNLSRLSRDCGWSRTELRTAVKQMAEWGFFFQLPPVSGGSVGEVFLNKKFIWSGSRKAWEDGKHWFEDENGN